MLRSEYQNQLDSCFQVIKSRTHIEHIYSHAGQNYSERESVILSALNELSQLNCLVLRRRQIANRTTKILLPNKYFSENNFKYNTSSLSSSSTESPYSNMFEMNENYTNLVNNQEDEDDYYVHEDRAKRNRNELISLQFENSNYQTFLYFFNKSAIACYLKLMRATQSIRSYYSANKEDFQTNFFILNENMNERRLNHYLKDEEFITNYLNVIVNMHMIIVNKMYKQLNSIDSSKSKDDKHIFRSLRVLGLRERNKNQTTQFQHRFSDIIDIRASFDIKQYQNKTDYECFIECEMNYYKINNDSISYFNQKISK